MIEVLIQTLVLCLLSLPYLIGQMIGSDIQQNLAPTLVHS